MILSLAHSVDKAQIPEYPFWLLNNDNMKKKSVEIKMKLRCISATDKIIID